MPAMEVDDLDDLIADSLGGVQSALDNEKKAAPAEASASSASAGDVVKELQQGPKEAPNEEFFSNLVKSFQDDNFQKAMAGALQLGDGEAGAAAGGAGEPEVGDFLQNFLKSFESAVGSDDGFAKSLSGLMTSMLSSDLVCEPLQQIADHLEPWLKQQKNLPAAERARFESQLALYQQIVGIYKSGPDPLPEEGREEVQRLLSELHSLGQPPDEVMKQIQPKDAEEGGENFEDFMKQMGLADGLGPAEQDLLKKLTEDPEELTKAMKEMAGQLGNEEDCKQQ